MLAFVCLLLICFPLNGCSATYKSDSMTEDIKRILKNDYGISEDVQIKVVGKTIGVYLPLEKLFSANMKALSSVTSKQEMENLFSFHPEAMEKVEDVLFTTSRVVLSAEKEIDFYVLKAVETSSTGIELVLTGYVDDMKRVRFWDISISEYRKRLLHDLSVNQTVVWKRAIQDLLEHIGVLSASDIVRSFFSYNITAKDVSPFFYSQLVEAEKKDNLEFDIQTIRVKPLSEKTVLVYVKATEKFEPKVGYEAYNFMFKNGATHEYLFILEAHKVSYKVKQVIPFYYIDENEQVRAIEFPEELKIYDNIDLWSEEFTLEEVHMGDFIARQLTKRLQAMSIQEERLRNAFPELKIECFYEEMINEDNKEEFIPYYEISYTTTPYEYETQTSQSSQKIEFTENEKLLITEAMREFAHVIYAYRFDDFEYVLIHNRTRGTAIQISPEEAQIVRKKKLSHNEFFSQF